MEGQDKKDIEDEIREQRKKGVEGQGIEGEIGQEEEKLT